MGAIELKSDLHKIIDKIQNEDLLASLYDFLKSRETTKSGNLWASLTSEQKEEVLMAYTDSEVEENLIDRSQFFASSK
ncbi:hypothetical protein [Gillisia hiemivivida]|jgi:hypothetical protein|uniref:Uncharacterized protein n=1 Tax=Gillisia hiemivivida TaxID=291190 RepID=A0A5C6ZXI9_9FLAO|nr:hypothetical protein [Gillisia hiemivivida]TXD95733.1 hypothetical protein ES724_01530 [Gillisia hiemivivida]